MYNTRDRSPFQRTRDLSPPERLIADEKSKISKILDVAPQKMLIVFDIDETLVHTVDTLDPSCSTEYVELGSYGYSYVRPGARALIKMLKSPQSLFLYMFWSAGRREYVEKVLSVLGFSDGCVGIKDRQDCVSMTAGRDNWTSHTAKLLATEGIAYRRVIQIDDRLPNLISNCYKVHIHAFNGEQDDPYLYELTNLLVHIYNYEKLVDQGIVQNPKPPQLFTLGVSPYIRAEEEATVISEDVIVDRRPDVKAKISESGRSMSATIREKMDSRRVPWKENYYGMLSICEGKTKMNFADALMPLSYESRVVPVQVQRGRNSQVSGAGLAAAAAGGQRRFEPILMQRNDEERTKRFVINDGRKSIAPKTCFVPYYQCVIRPTTHRSYSSGNTFTRSKPVELFSY